MAAMLIAKQHTNHFKTEVGFGLQQYSRNQAKNVLFLSLIYFFFYIVATISVQCLAFYCRVCGSVKSSQVFGEGRNIVILLISVLCRGILSRIHANNAILQCIYSAGY